MSRYRRTLPTAPVAALLCALLAGCGLSSGPANDGGHAAAAPHGSVSLALTAPTDGATVGVRRIEVVGSVNPAGASVTVGGHSTRLAGGSFAQTVWLNGAATTIAVRAQAPGYAAATAVVTVRYSPSLAVAMAQAHRAVFAPPAAAVSSLPRLQPGPAAAPAATVPVRFMPLLNQGTSAASAGGSTTAARTTATSTPTTPPPPPATPAPAASATTPTTATPAPTPSPVLTPTVPIPVTPAQIEQDFVSGCSQAGGPAAAAYCGCLGTQLARSGQLSSEKTVAHLRRSLLAFVQTGDLRMLPVTVRRAQADCAGKIPQPPLPIRSLPGLHHSAVPAPGQP